MLCLHAIIQSGGSCWGRVCELCCHLKYYKLKEKCKCAMSVKALQERMSTLTNILVIY